MVAMELGSAEHNALLDAFAARVRSVIRAQIAAEHAEAEALRARVVPLVREAVGAVRSAGHCREVWLFGSFAWGNPGARSDVDVLVVGDANEVGYAIGRATSREVHALGWDEAPPELRARATSEGLPL